MPSEENERQIGQRRGNREHVNIVTENTKLIRKKIIQRRGKACNNCGKSNPLSPTAVVTSNTWAEAKKTNGPVVGNLSSCR